MALWKKFNIFSLITIGIVMCIDYDLNACGNICQCDEYKNYIRVTCHEQNINTVENLGAPNNVEFLDLSKNSLSSLGNLVFQSYPLIVNLTLSFNHITTLYLDTFSSLKSLMVVDISNNLIEEFDNRMFEENTKLVSVDLSCNKFMLWQEDHPILISKSLENLSLQNSQLNHIYPTFFRNLPNLKKLDLSNNLLITLFNKQFSYSTNLEFLNLKGNVWQCDRDLELTVEYLKRNNVKVVNDHCLKEVESPVKAVKFEKMQMAPSSLDNLLSKDRRKSLTNVAFDIPTEKIIPFFNDIFPMKPRTMSKTKYSFENEYEKCAKRVEELQDRYNELEISRLSSSDVYFIFLIGVAMGSIGIMLSVTCCICIHKMCRKSIKKRNAVHTSGAGGRRLNQQSPFMSGVVERPRDRRRRQQYERINQIGSNIATTIVHTEIEAPVNGSFIASSAEGNPQNVVIAFRPETPPPSYFDIVAKK